ncbi:hypothetical protein JJC03_03750 [Flavobacterium oreochromis]|uniref:hypothetical protein n=1 Tax=Flavobacterium oreochromis TaxID=2906078 RepID=UPI001CE636C2|nr:hypothetical protein [Flavobacterium oreochromis]QYS87091.1 hypothetical protein JJC03_03750 [Flavobacterium oreochromis]
MLEKINKKVFIYGIVFGFISFLVSCDRDEKQIEKNNVDNFNKNSSKFDNSIAYIASKYFTKNENVKVILSDKNYQKNNIYYDSSLKTILKNTNIRLVNIYNNNPCQENKFPYELFFEINSTSSRQYYYVYRFCEHNYLNIDESLNYKVIPLNKNWKMDIEKN